MSERYETHEHDVLVIGAGGAGLRAAIEASAAGVSVELVCKSLLGNAHTVMAEGGIAAALGHLDPQDGWQTHFMDSMKGGSFLNHWRMAQLQAQQAPDRVRELEQWGALFDRTPDGRILQRAFGGHTWKRLAHVGDRTGLEMIRTLQDRGVHAGMDVYMECTITRLLKDGDRIAGALGYWRESGRFVVFRAKSVVIATGGVGKAYRITSNSWEYTGDGQSLAYEAGAELIDMEFLQFHITKQPMEVGPTTHYMMGGLRVDPDTAAATVPGLFAAGEAAAGLHGANRLGGNPLSDLLVFGRRAGAGAAAHAKSLASTPAPDDAEIEAETRALLSPFERGPGESPYDVHRALQKCMDRLVGIYRVQADLHRAIEELQSLKARATAVRVEGTRMFNPGWHLARDLQNMITVSEAIARSAALRKESRGAHSRLDHTGLDPALGQVNHCVTRGAEGMRVAATPRVPMPAELQQLFEPAGTPKQETGR